MERKTRQRGTQRRVPLVESPRADKVTTLHLRTSANYCLCPEFIPPWRCRHFVGGSVLRYAAAAFKASLVKGGASKGGGGGIGGRLIAAPTIVVSPRRIICGTSGTPSPTEINQVQRKINGAPGRRAPRTLSKPGAGAKHSKKNTHTSASQSPALKISPLTLTFRPKVLKLFCMKLFSQLP